MEVLPNLNHTSKNHHTFSGIQEKNLLLEVVTSRKSYLVYHKFRSLLFNVNYFLFQITRSSNMGLKLS